MEYHFSQAWNTRFHAHVGALGRHAELVYQIVFIISPMRVG